MRSHGLDTAYAREVSPQNDLVSAIKAEYEAAEGAVAAIESNCNTLSKLYMRERQKNDQDGYIIELEAQLNESRKQTLDLKLTLTDRE